MRMFSVGWLLVWPVAFFYFFPGRIGGRVLRENLVHLYVEWSFCFVGRDDLKFFLCLAVCLWKGPNGTGWDGTG